MTDETLTRLESPEFEPEPTDAVCKCRKCGVVKPLTSEYFPRNKRRKCGLARKCHLCNREDVKAWVIENRKAYNRNQRTRYARRRALKRSASQEKK
jgi:hypothetical protein